VAGPERPPPVSAPISWNELEFICSRKIEGDHFTILGLPAVAAGSTTCEAKELLKAMNHSTRALHHGSSGSRIRRLRRWLHGYWLRTLAARRASYELADVAGPEQFDAFFRGPQG